MIFKQDNSLTLIMWERTMLPESVPSKNAQGKTEYVKTGNKIEFTTYIFRDSFGNKLQFTSKNNSYRIWEGKKVIVRLDVEFNDYDRKNKIALDSVEPDTEENSY